MVYEIVIKKVYEIILFDQGIKKSNSSFPDMKVRELAVSRIKDLTNDELVDYLPQLLQALKHETYEASPLARFLLERALLSPRVAHHVYWLLNQALPGDSPQVRYY